MNESFLHYVWLTTSFNISDLQTTKNQSIQLIKTGRLHQDGGPDFSHAHIHIENTTWVGDVEIHIKSSDWYAHKHHLDETYNSTILHVCYECDRDVFLSDGSLLPCVELHHRISPNLINRYESLISNSHIIPCERLVSKLDPELKAMVVHRMAVERLEGKALRVLQSLKDSNGDWAEVFYQELCTTFGLRVNKLPFEMLSKALPINLLLKHRNNLDQLEALIFGASGFLIQKPKDAYSKKLKKEFTFLQNKYQLEVLQPHIWKFLRLRPANFATIRLAQLAMMIHKSDHLFRRVLEAESFLEYKAILSTDVSEYWNSHFNFGLAAKKPSAKHLGETTVLSLIINAVVPVKYAYFQQHDDGEKLESLLDAMSALPPEINAITKVMNGVGFSQSSAIDSQGILQLKNNYCNLKKCLQCSLGHRLLRKQEEV
ncbi:MAG: hypothetical protein ACI8ZN_000838 [Bacteroidia bacterium]|jgi:hypothetical protein